MAQIELKQLSKEYKKDVKVIDDLNLAINNGEFLVLVGPSGCGKSTTLRLIAGLEEITEGDIYIGEDLVNNVAPKNRGVSMVFQNYALYPHMNVYENMAFGLKLRKYGKDEIKARVEEAAKILEISPLLERRPKHLSGGQKQRVALGRAIVRKPKVFLFDEPLSNLDAKLRVQMRTEIKKLHQRLKTTMIYVTHDQVEAMTMGDRIAVMKDGIIHQVDTPIKLYKNPVDLFVAGFIGSPSMNFIRATIKNNSGLYADEGDIRIDIPEDQNELLEPYIDKEVILGVRPEDLYLYEPNMKSTKIQLSLEVFEPMGNETNLYLTTGKTKVVVISKEFTPDQAQPKENMDLYIDMSKVHYFDPDSEKVIKSKKAIKV
ncbi:MAG: sn-glycerol-3-phosphate ABC transporter ATP-binding protein UgpC [Candidatus Marinimicrobia bacterium]|nr:sn-glycerol-3-phosphate ABC transporter ATP-binding protein UgpC [Candidatus Neomarinimicrobiota bacterium]